MSKDRSPRGRHSRPADTRRDAPARRDRNGAGQTFRPKPRHAAPTEAKRPDRDAAPRRRRSGERPRQAVPVILEARPDDDYALLDTGDGRKLEQYGAMRLVRPEQQAIWGKALPASEWDAADAIFTGDTDEEGVGRWRFPKARHGETWPMRFDGIGYLGRFTSFRHVGVFAEQAVHWRAMDQAISRAGRPVRVLNLFGYTGIASLVAARAGAEVTHVDASKKAIGWARENQAHAGLEDKPIRWICEDAMKFVVREGRRGNVYDIVLLDPPAYGRGPAGEVWQLFEHLPDMLDGCRAILTERPLMMVLTAYAIRASMFAIHELMMETMTGFAPPGRNEPGYVESGELVLREKAADRALSTSMFSRWTPGA
ncbi:MULTISPECIES: RsmD family RNA methyltransferase [unclassified Roseitalea]|uniref:RsmD family RNA methyltransferase n=1 Tax=unclassified Roseitalea TaxID=2639107 RepID=UPI00273D1FEE|nr:MULTISPECIES: RsmD family RNA methyltransferase [unclassified Roseitalea]